VLFSDVLFAQLHSYFRLRKEQSRTPQNLAPLLYRLLYCFARHVFRISTWRGSFTPRKHFSISRVRLRNRRSPSPLGFALLRVGNTGIQRFDNRIKPFNKQRWVP